MTNDNEENFNRKITFLESNLRKSTLPPEKILKDLEIGQDSVILDAGAGSGYLSIPAAKQTDNVVFALDMDQRMLNVIKRKAETEDLENIRLIQGDIGDIPLPNESVDIVIASLILHEVESLSIALKEISRVLKRGGYFLCLEYEKEEIKEDSQGQQGPPMNKRIPASSMEEALANVGLETFKKTMPKKPVYILKARKMEKIFGDSLL